jgi:hypothetical protein
VHEAREGSRVDLALAMRPLDHLVLNLRELHPWKARPLIGVRSTPALRRHMATTAEDRGYP